MKFLKTHIAILGSSVFLTGYLSYLKSTQAQTHVVQSVQSKGTTLIPNVYSTYADIGGKVQLLPGPFYSNVMVMANVSAPSSSSAICGRSVDGESHPAYEFGRTGNVIVTSDAMYVCNSNLQWRRIALSEF